MIRDPETTYAEEQGAHCPRWQRMLAALAFAGLAALAVADGAARVAARRARRGWTRYVQPGWTRLVQWSTWRVDCAWCRRRMRGSLFRRADSHGMCPRCFFDLHFNP